MHTQKAGQPKTFAQRFELDDEHTEREKLYARLQQAFNNLTWYEQGLIELYMQHGNYRAIQKATGIPHQSAWTTIKNAFAKMKKELQNDAC